MKKVEIKRQMTEIKITTVICDKCSKEIKHHGNYDAFLCTIELRTGDFDAHDGSHWGDHYKVDLCEQCAKTLFLETFPSLGIKVTDEFGDYIK